MTITLEIRPEVEAELARKAGLAGRALETYAAKVLEDSVHLPASEAADDSEQGFGSKLVEVCAKVRGLLTDEEIDTLFDREPSTDRPVNFE